MISLIFLLFSALPGFAETYDLKNLRSISVSVYPNATGQRHFLRFQNDQGTHTVVYEESSAQPTQKEIETLQSLMLQSVCNVEMECSTKAVCTGDCKNMYYETTNAPMDPQFMPKNKCKIKNLTCTGK